MIHYITPFRTDGDIGRAYNESIDSLKVDEDDWIVIRDGDTAFVTPNWGLQIQEVAENTDYDLLGCITGRLRHNEQLYENRFDTEMNIHKCHKIGLKLEREKWCDVREVNLVAGFFMMFQYRTWVRVGRFGEKTLKVDMKFSSQVKKIGGKIGVIEGLYIFHAYRPWEVSQIKAANSIKHLK